MVRVRPSLCGAAGRFTNSQPILPFRRVRIASNGRPFLEINRFKRSLLPSRSILRIWFGGDFALENGFAHFEGATPFGEILTDVSRACIVDLSVLADLAFAHTACCCGSITTRSLFPLLLNSNSGLFSAFRISIAENGLPVLLRNPFKGPTFRSVTSAVTSSGLN